MNRVVSTIFGLALAAALVVLGLRARRERQAPPAPEWGEDA